MAFAMVGLSSCENEDDAREGYTIPMVSSVNGVINSNGNLSSLQASLKVASGDLPMTLDSDGPFTIFAPDNAAFTALAKDLGFATSADMLAQIDADLLSTILTYHVVMGENGADALTQGKALATVMGDELTVSVDEESNIEILDATKLPQTATGASVTLGSPIAPNGIVHIINKVLLPQSIIEAYNIDIRPSILDWATSTEDLTALTSALKKTNLVDTISELKSATVLAPNNEAFENLLETLGDDYNSLEDFDNPAEIAVLSDILKYHVLTSELMAGEVETALMENTVSVVANGETFSFGTATTLTADIEAKNGSVQIIDEVLLPQAALDFMEKLASEDLATLITRVSDLSIMEEALLATELNTPFIDASNESFVQGEDETDEAFAERSTPDNFTYFNQATVFVPTNVAFQELLDVLGDGYNSIADFDTDEEKALLKEILLYHVVEGKVDSADLTAGNVTTVAESDITIINVVGTDTFVIGDATNNVNANIRTADIAARNGVAHYIDKVLLPKNAIAFINALNAESGD